MELDGRCAQVLRVQADRQRAVGAHADGGGAVAADPLGRGIRALRLRRRWRQEDLADAADVSRSMVARIEVGNSDGIPVRQLDKVATAVGPRTDLRLNWNGEALDRLLDSAHAAIVDAAAEKLRAFGWEVAAEVTFSIRGERGSVDLLAWHTISRVVLVLEVKSVVPDIQAMLAALDKKARLAIEMLGLEAGRRAPRAGCL